VLDTYVGERLDYLRFDCEVRKKWAIRSYGRMCRKWCGLIILGRTLGHGAFQFCSALPLIGICGAIVWSRPLQTPAGRPLATVPPGDNCGGIRCVLRGAV
jgi:hypothetical protein